MLEIEALRNREDSPVDGILRIYDRFLIRIRDLFDAGIEKGFFADHDPMLLAVSLDSATNALMKLSRTQPDTFTYEARVDEILTIFFDPILLKKTIDRE